MYFFLHSEQSVVEMKRETASILKTAGFLFGSCSVHAISACMQRVLRAVNGRVGLLCGSPEISIAALIVNAWPLQRPGMTARKKCTSQSHRT